MLKIYENKLIHVPECVSLSKKLTANYLCTIFHIHFGLKIQCKTK